MDCVGAFAINFGLIGTQSGGSGAGDTPNALRVLDAVGLIGEGPAGLGKLSEVKCEGTQWA